MAYVEIGWRDVERYGLTVVLGFSLLTSNLLIIGIAVAAIAIFNPYAQKPTVKERNYDFVI